MGRSFSNPQKRLWARSKEMELFFAWIIPAIVTIIVLLVVGDRLTGEYGYERRLMLYRGGILLAAFCLLLWGKPLAASYADSMEAAVNAWGSQMAQMTAMLAVMIACATYWVAMALSGIFALNCVLASVLAPNKSLRAL